MPDKTISILGYTAGGFVALYLGLMVSTVYFVSTETRATTAMHSIESKISVLEKEYYAAISAVNAENPSAYGLVRPLSVSYVEAPLRGTLSSAQN